MGQVIISIGREYGSGGHELAAKLAERLSLPLYDRKMLDHILDDVDKKDKPAISERILLRRRHGLTRNTGNAANTTEDTLAEAQFRFIEAKAAAGESFVIVGRCAEKILEGNEALISIFVRAQKSAKIERIKRIYNLNDIEAKAKMVRHDRQRKAYHNYHSNMKWGDSRAYDLCINASAQSMEDTLDILYNYVKVREGVK